jgi:L-threonylcarbamoyladenylate synthase
MTDPRISDAVEILRKGGTVVYPTETVYGIGCDPINRSACERIQQMKKRVNYKTLLLISCDIEQVEKTLGKLNETGSRLAQVFWPGPLTMVIRPEKEMPDYLYGISSGIAVRVTSHPIASELAREFGAPIISTSANLTGDPPIVTYEDALELFGSEADIILKNPEPLHGKPSTVVDVTTGSIALIREGGISEERLREVI